MERFSSGLSAASKRLKRCSTLRWSCVRREIAFMVAPYPATARLRLRWEDGAVAPPDSLLGDAVRRAQASAPDHLIEAIAEPCRAAGIDDPELYLVDHEGTTLTRAPRPPREAAQGRSLPIAGTDAGEAF